MLTGVSSGVMSGRGSFSRTITSARLPCTFTVSLLSFGVKPSGSMSAREAGAKVLDAFKLFTRLVNIGDARSLATHSASTTHRQLSAEELKKAGVSEDMIRLSIGLEHADDLIADLDQALSVI